MTTDDQLLDALRELYADAAGVAAPGNGFDVRWMLRDWPALERVRALFDERWQEGFDEGVWETNMGEDI